MIRQVLIFTAFLLGVSALWAQDGANPFELVHRLPKTALASNDPLLSVNPFDVVPHRPPGVSSGPAANETRPFKPFSFLPKGNALAERSLIWILIAMFGYLAFSVAVNRSAVEKAWRAFLNDNSLSMAQREAQGLAGLTPYYLLYVNFLINAGLFVFIVTRFFNRENYNNSGFLAACLGGMSFYFLSKHAMLQAAKALYPVANEVRRYNFLIIVFNCILGLFLAPFNLFIAFLEEKNWAEFLVFWTLGLVAIFFLYRATRALSIGLKFLVDEKFHFLLYLCTVELAPLLLLWKLMAMQ